MKFINYLESISGVSIYPMTSLIICFLFFVILGLKVYMMDKDQVNEISHLPIEEQDNIKTDY